MKPIHRQSYAIFFAALIAAFTGAVHAQSEPAEAVAGAHVLENLGLPNWKGHDYSPQISPNGEYLIFQSDRPGRYEGHNLWYARNANFSDRFGRPDWSVPIPLSLPLGKPATPTMKIVRPVGTLEDPDGGFSVNSDGFEGMFSVVYRNGAPVELYFTSPRRSDAGGYAGLNIYFTRFRDERWSPPIHLNEINTNFDDRMPVVSHDGRHMYFVSNRPGGFGGNDIWYSYRELNAQSKDPHFGMWTKPVNAGEVWNTRFHENAPSLSPDGEIFFFSSDRPGGFGHYDLYFSRRNGNIWEQPKNLGADFNSGRDDEYFSMTHDGLWVYFASDRRQDDARGEFDLYRRSLPEWLRMNVKVLFTGQILDGSTRRPLGVAATLHIDYEEETMVLRSSVFRKDPALNESEYENNFSTTLDAGRRYRVVVSAPGFHPQELSLDYTAANPPKKLDRHVIVLQPIRIEPVEPEKRMRSEDGVVVDAKTGLRIPGPAARLLLSVEGEDPVPVEVDDNGRFRIFVPEDTVFTLRAEAQQYESKTETFTHDPNRDLIVMALDPLPEGPPCPDNQKVECIYTLRVFFEFREADVPNTEAEKINAVARILTANPTVSIRLIGHTDRIGGDQYNLRLSESRARSVRDALIARGIAADRLRIEGRGKLEPYDPSDRALNRRVEFRQVKE